MTIAAFLIGLAIGLAAYPAWLIIDALISIVRTGRGY
jgi:hypothetical protein